MKKRYVARVFKNRGVDINTEFLENRGVDMDRLNSVGNSNFKTIKYIENLLLV